MIDFIHNKLDYAFGVVAGWGAYLLTYLPNFPNIQLQSGLHPYTGEIIIQTIKLVFAVFTAVCVVLAVHIVKKSLKTKE